MQEEDKTIKLTSKGPDEGQILQTTRKSRNHYKISFSLSKE